MRNRRVVVWIRHLPIGSAKGLVAAMTRIKSREKGEELLLGEISGRWYWDATSGRFMRDRRRNERRKTQVVSPPPSSIKLGKSHAVSKPNLESRPFCAAAVVCYAGLRVRVLGVVSTLRRKSVQSNLSAFPFPAILPILPTAVNGQLTTGNVLL
jgi:hypothetical protein